MSEKNNAQAELLVIMAISNAGFGSLITSYGFMCINHDVIPDFLIPAPIFLLCLVGMVYSCRKLRGN